jgi:hypothetical protein
MDTAIGKAAQGVRRRAKASIARPRFAAWNQVGWMRRLRRWTVYRGRDRANQPAIVSFDGSDRFLIAHRFSTVIHADRSSHSKGAIVNPTP